MPERKLLDGRIVGELPSAVDMTINSKCPGKWLFVDTETGDVWHASLKEGKYQFYRASANELDALKMALVAAKAKRGPML